MTPYTLHQGDCRDVMAGMDADRVDAIVCDPPYGLRFMGKGWDHGVPGVEFWQAAKRVAKPGAHLLAFGGTRTFHRLTVAIEDAGWEIRDTIMWVYGSGFPKSLDVSKAIDAAAGAEREVVGSKHLTGMTATRETFGADDRSGGKGMGFRAGDIALTAPATPEAQQWQGWGTALKPAWEPIIVARKPLAGTVAANVLRYGTGGLNVDACRIVTEEPLNGGAYSGDLRQRANYSSSDAVADASLSRLNRGVGEFTQPLGRWPANLIHDGSEDVVSLFPEEQRGMASGGEGARDVSMFGVGGISKPEHFRADSGSAARFFYTAKASREDRNDGTERVITWEHVDLRLEMEQARQHLKAISEATIAPLVASECATMWFGRKQTGLSPTDIKCITETVIRLITDWRTYNSSPLWNISASIQGAIRMMPDGGSSLAEGAACISSLKRTTTSGETGSLPVAVAALWLLLSQINSKGKRGNTHSTVKPTSLMRYLCRLVTPRDGIVLDPFMGSGSTGKAAILEGFRFIGIDLEPEYVEIARARCEWAMAQPRQLVLEDAS